MFNWISPFNYDFAIATIPIQIILLVFYGIRSNLPTKQSFYFWLAMFANLIMTSADIISCEMNEIWMEYPLVVMYVINHAYFLAFIIRGWALFSYTCESTYCSEEKHNLFRLISSIPAATACFLIIITPWFSTIYTIAKDGYHNCSLYKMIYFSTYFYIILSIVLVIICFKKLTRRMRIGLLAFNILLLFGILIRKQFYHILVTSYFSILSIMIIYLTSENPDLFKENRTRLLNEIALNRIGKEFWQKNIPFSLITVAINNYEASKMVYSIKQVNDELAVIASWLTKNYPKDYVFYTRNGNFIILLKGHMDMQYEEIVTKWKEIYTTLNTSYSDNIPIQMSMMLLPDSFINSNNLFVSELARYAISNAHAENRKNNYIFSIEMLEGAQKQKAIEKALKKAIVNHSFEVYFQPIYSVKDNKVLGAEALARLYDLELGYISPVEFIAIAEKNGDIIEVGKQIFEKVCAFLQTTDSKELGIEFINVNLSPIQCLNPNLVKDLMDITQKYGIPINMFDFEITESLIDDYEAIKITIAKLRAMGAELSLDDFGTGAANLTSLMNLPIHVVKIDMSFVRSYFDGKAEFLPDLVKLFRHANMKIVVEGIETDEMRNKMAELGCDYEQGFYFSKPLPPEKFIQYMQQLS